MPRGQPGSGKSYARYLQVKGAAAELHELHEKIKTLLTMYPELADGRLPGDVEMEPEAPGSDVYTRALPPVRKTAKLLPAPVTHGGKLRGHPTLTNRGTPRKRKPWSDESRARMSALVKERKAKERREQAKLQRQARHQPNAAAQKQTRLEYEQQRVAEEQEALGKE